MAGIVYELMDVLQAQQECYEGLNLLATYTQTAIVKKQLEFLNDIVHTEEQFLGRLNLLDQKRESLMKDIAIVTGLNMKTITLSGIIKKIGAETEVGLQLTTLKNGIKGQLDQLRSQSELNKVLLDQSLEIVDFTIKAMGSMKGYSYVGNYNKPGEEPNVEHTQSLFDKKQ